MFWKWLFNNIIPNPSYNNNLEDIQEMITLKYIVSKESTSWKAKQTGNTQWFELTNKGIKYLVKNYNLKYENQ